MKKLSKDYSFYTKDAAKEAAEESVKSYKKSLKENVLTSKQETSILCLFMTRMENFNHVLLINV